MKPKSTELQFFGWDRPILAVAATTLAERYGAGPGLSLTDLTVVVPGQRAGRSLLAALTREAERQGTVLLPPRIVTPGRLPELLYVAGVPEISALEGELLWVSILRGNPDRLAALFPAATSTDRFGQCRFGQWLGLASQLSRLRTDLATTGKAVPDLLEELIESYELSPERWSVICDLAREFESGLDQLGVTDMHLARLRALQRGEFLPLKNCFLIGTLDLPPVVKLFLEKSGAEFESWVHAPRELAAGFDRFGCVVPSFWSSFPIEVDESLISFERRPLNQAEESARAIASWSGEASADDIVIAAPDEAIVPHIEEVLGALDVPVRDAGGISRASVGPVVVAELIARFLSSKSLQDLGSLVRHPDILAWLQRNKTTEAMAREDLISALDKYQQHSLPQHLGKKLPGTISQRQIVEALHQAIVELVSAPSDKEAALSEWCPPIRALFLSLYGDRALHRGNTREKAQLETLEALDSEIQEFERIPGAVAPKLSYGEALSLMVQRCGAERVEPNTFESAIEMVGWLELYLDDRPFVIVTACNEGFLPESANEDPFLPNSLRHKIGITDNAIRYARDAAVLCSLLHSRKGLKLIVGGLGAQDEIRPPSRLLLSDPKTVGDRIKRFYGAFSEESGSSDECVDKGATKLLPIKPEGLVGNVKEVSVTGISLYLECPYRFYLRHVEHLKELRDDARELNGMEFGNLGHEVLSRFAAEESLTALSDPAQVAEALSELLDSCVQARFGRAPLPAVKLQIEQLRRRVGLFSHWQAGSVAAGWRIKFAEHEMKGVLLTSTGELTVKARIDRVDFNVAEGRYAVYDYKFGDDQDTLASKHTGKKGLQLPLYRMLLRQAKISEDPVVGILPFSGSEDHFKPVLSNLKPEAYAELEADAVRAAEGILQGVFWPPSDSNNSFDPYRGICGVGTVVEEEADGEEAIADG